jgi:23S rRNA (uracil1939-C5)-methyltransferase
MRDVDIVGLGASGDGLVAGERLHIPRSLPGERVRIADARIQSILSPSPDRVAAPCPHFAELCGGCALQHFADTPYAAWKRGRVIDALRRAGITDPPVAPLVRTPPGARRRMDFAVRRAATGIRLGLHATGSDSIVDIAGCIILHPALQALLPPLRSVLNSLQALGREASIVANLLSSGPDLLIRTDRALSAADRSRLADFAGTNGVTRIAWAHAETAPETAALLGPVFAEFAGHRMEPPPGAFLQASLEGERAIVEAMLAAVPRRLTRKSFAIELFAGIGTLSFPLADRLRVKAFEGDAPAAAAVRRAQAGTCVEMTLRDLARRPLSARDFADAAMVVLDPPYTGAAAQMAALAASSVPLIVYVSCNPVALAKDAAVLHGAGYRALSAVPIDQFLWSAHVETVVTFART